MDRNIYKKIKSSVDGAFLMNNTEKLWKLEFGQQFENYRKASRFAEELLKESGLKEVERIPFPADGKTVYQDKTMPLCWRAGAGRLTVVKSPLTFSDPVAADISRHPFHLIKGSVSIPPGGVRAKLITYEQMFQGEDARGAVVIAPPDARDKKELYSALCDFGALAMVYDWLGSRYETPDELHWVNGWTEGPHWHVIQTDRPLVGFSVSPRTGDALRNAARKGEVIVHAESTGENFEDEIDVVTGVLPGADSRELWLLAHLYEPLSADNSAGAACAAEIARSISSLAEDGKIPRPRFSIRVVYGLEMYGFAAYAHSRGGCLKDSVIGALNLDGIAVSKDGDMEAVLAPPLSGFYGNHIAESLLSDPGVNPFSDCRINESGMYSDDMFLADSTTGVPTIWFQQKKGFWHNSIQTMEIIDGDVFRNYAGLAACWAYAAANPFQAEDIEAAFRAAGEKLSSERSRALSLLNSGSADMEALRAGLKLRLRRESGIIRGAGKLAGGAVEAVSEEKTAALREAADKMLEELSPKAPPGEKPAASEQMKRAESIVSERASVGLPYDLAAAAKSGRRILPERIIYGPLARILSNMDGKKTLAEVIKEARWELSLFRGSAHAAETGQDIPEIIGEAEVKKYIGAVEYLTRAGYLRTRYEAAVRKDDIAGGLKSAGVSKGDVLFVHSALSAFGHIEGGADAVIEAMLEVIGGEGTLIMPEFTRSFIYFDGLATGKRKPRPFDIDSAENVIVGELPRAFLGRPGVVRSPHPTHSAAAFGKLADFCVAGHREDDPPCGKNSPLGKLPELDGKILFFGADPACTTFFHFLEDDRNLPYLAGCVCTVKNPDGSLRAVLTPKSVPGHRDFYSRPGEDSKMYRRLSEKGLEIKRQKLGFGELKLVRARQMYSLGVEALEEDPAILLCDDDECGFCREGRRRLR